MNINATVNVTTSGDRDHVQPGTSIPIDIMVTGAVLVDMNATPPPEHIADAVYVNVYLDDVNSSPILVTAQTHVDVTVPASTPEGHHRLLCRLHKHDGTPTSVMFSFDFTVTVSAGGGTDGGSSAVDGG